MKKANQKLNKKGFSMIEMILVLAVVGTLMLMFLPQIIPAVANSSITTAAGSIKSVQNVSPQYYQQNGNTFTGGTTGSISIANLGTLKLINATAVTNPFGGAITVAPDADGTHVDVTLTNVPSAAVGTQITTALGNAVNSANVTYTAATKTYMAPV